MRSFLHYCLTRTPVIGLLMAALLFRALIPAGFMPTRADDGAIVMELCSGWTTKSVEVQLGEPAAADPGHDANAALFDHAPCGFAVAAHAATPPATFQLVPPLWLQSPLSGIRLTAAVLAPLRRSQSPRGPPTL